LETVSINMEKPIGTPFTDTFTNTAIKYIMLFLVSYHILVI
jgi:hypothetical protein